jgi:hypothetical protein
MSRTVFVLLILALVASACTVTSKSGEASEPVRSNELTSTDAGNIALTTAEIDATTCSGVLGAAPEGLVLNTESLTSTAVSEAQQIELTCAASYESSIPGDPFMTATLTKFESDGPAIERYEMIKEGFVTNNHPISELNSADENLTDQVSALIDGDGVGRTIVLRKKSKLVTVSIGPTMAAVPWTAADIEIIGKSILERWVD